MCVFPVSCWQSCIQVLPILSGSVGFMGFFFTCWEVCCSPRPPSPFLSYGSNHVEEVLCNRCVVSPVKVSGCPSAPRVPRAGPQRWPAAPRAGPRLRPSPRSRCNSTRPSALSPRLCCTHDSVNKVRASFVHASTRVCLPVPLLPLKIGPIRKSSSPTSNNQNEVRIKPRP